jgi:hypothetical protein
MGCGLLAGGPLSFGPDESVREEERSVAGLDHDQVVGRAWEPQGPKCPAFAGSSLPALPPLRRRRTCGQLSD